VPERQPWQTQTWAFTWMGLYPRAWEEEPHRDLYGAYDLITYFGVGERTLFDKLKHHQLPLADGPDINGYPTWKRSTILVYFYLQHKLPVRYMAETLAFLVGPEGKATLESVKAQCIDRRPKPPPGPLAQNA
jgi:hypothetical protein